MSYYKDQLNQWLQTIDVNTEGVLDIGGGADPVKDRVRTFNVDDYKIADNNMEKEYHSEWIVDYVFDLNTDTIEGYWNVIFCLEVFEYIYDALSAISIIYEGLTDDGIAYISFPSIYPVHEPKEYDYMRYTKNGIIKLLDEAGFDRWDIVARVANDEGANKLAEFYRADGMHPVRNDRVIFDTGYMVTAYK